MFILDLDSIIDFGQKDPLTIIKNSEDRAYTLAYREVERIGCMCSVDMTVSKIKEINGTKTYA